MTSRERIIAALERREPDRLPTFEWRISRPIIEGGLMQKPSNAIL